MRRRIEESSPDIVCVTEGFAEILPRDGYAVDSDADYGYTIRKGRRKVLLWSRSCWMDVDRLGSPDMPTGRYVAGATETPLGPIRVMGVCIPWRDAHVRTGRKDRKAWEDHRRYLAGLRAALDGSTGEIPAVVVGDFNQRIPRKRAPKPVFEELVNTFQPEFSICTSGSLDRTEVLSIDHVAHSAELEHRRTSILPKVSEEGVRLSDHFGLVVDLRAARPSDLPGSPQ